MKRVLLLALVGILLLPSCGLVGLYSLGTPPGNHSSGDSKVEVDNLLFDILAVDETKTIPGVLPKTFTTSNYFLIIQIRITNASDIAQSFYSTDVLVKLDVIEYKHLAMESYWYGKARAVPNVEGLSYGGLIERRSSIERFLVFEVPCSIDEAGYILLIHHDLCEEPVRVRDRAYSFGESPDGDARFLNDTESLSTSDNGSARSFNVVFLHCLKANAAE